MVRQRLHALPAKELVAVGEVGRTSMWDEERFSGGMVFGRRSRLCFALCHESLWRRAVEEVP